jgi:excinuclease ABC subunit A
MDQIVLRGARTHNLKNLDLSLPRDKLVVITGLSGSGKSSLAFDTLYAEGQRRYVESLSAYARQFLSVMEKPDVDHIEGLSPAISIEQKTTSHNPRSTVGTVTEIYDYLRLLFARAGSPQCPEHRHRLEAQSVSQMIDQVLALTEGTKLMLLSPVIRNRKGEQAVLIEQLKIQGYLRARANGKVYELENMPALDPKKKNNLEVVIDRFKVNPDLRTRLSDSFETALKLSKGLAIIAPMPENYNDISEHTLKKEFIFSAKFACPDCGYSIEELEPRLFSFNNPAGACPTCDGLGIEEFFDASRLVQQPTLSLASGAITGWDKRNPYYFALLESLSKHYGFDLDKPYHKLAKKVQEMLLYGNKEEVINFYYPNDRGRPTIKRHAFEGIIPSLERRYASTSSDQIHTELGRYLAKRPCVSCEGTRLGLGARNVFIGDKNLPALTHLPIDEALTFFKTLQLGGNKQQIADKILKEIGQRLEFLIDVGLNYLSLDRTADTLSGGEAQRIRLASQIGAGLVGVLYILDEPSIGLHQRDNHRLLRTLRHLRDIGNTVIVVEHDEEAILSADYVLDMGPGAGVHGGYVIAAGTPEEVKNHPDSLTGKYLSRRLAIEIPSQRKTFDPEKDKAIILEGVTGNNLKDVTVSFPIGLFTCITGVSGSGKSTLINDTLYPLAAQKLNRAEQKAAPHRAIHGLEHLDKVVGIDQSPIGRTPRSNAATYTGLFTHIRELFACTQEARARGYGPGRFSFNVKGGRCEACQGDGLTKVEMHFLADIYVTCDVCHARRYNQATLEVHYKGKNIHDILEMSVEEALEFFHPIPAAAKKLETLKEVGLSYLKIGQNATTLSGGEAQRIKLAKELSRRDTGSTLYILDEPTTGLHFHDVQQLLNVLKRLQSHGNTIIIIEHNLDVIKTADWLIDLGPEGGNKGGTIIACGSPEHIANVPESYTGQFLKKILEE